MYFRIRTHRENLPGGARLNGELAKEALFLWELTGADQLSDEVNLRHRPRDIALFAKRYACCEERGSEGEGVDWKGESRATKQAAVGRRRKGGGQPGMRLRRCAPIVTAGRLSASTLFNREKSMSSNAIIGYLNPSVSSILGGGRIPLSHY